MNPHFARFFGHRIFRLKSAPDGLSEADLGAGRATRRAKLES